MVRSYLRHEPVLAFALVASPSPTARVLLDPRDARTAYAPALEDILVWDTRHGAQLAAWHDTGHRAPVTALARAPNAFAVGYADGSIRLWDAAAATPTLTLHGHSAPVTALAFDPAGLRLASGSQDTALVLWDIVAEAGLVRLSGHRDALTQLAFVPGLHARYLLSTAKDGCLKLWDLALQHCIDTAIPGKGELWSMATARVRNIDPATLPKKPTTHSAAAGTPAIVVVTGGTDGHTRVYELDANALRAGLAPGSSNTAFFRERGSIALAAKGRVSQIEFAQPHPRTALDDDDDDDNATYTEPDYLAISSSDRSVQIFRVRTEDELRRKHARQQRRKLKDAAQKGQRNGHEHDDEDDHDHDNDVDGIPREPSWLDRLHSHTVLRPSTSAAGARLRSFSLALASTHSATATARARALATSKPALHVLLGLTTNALETWSVPAPLLGKPERAAVLLPQQQPHPSNTAPIEPALSASLDLPGHRSDVRALALSPDDALLASADSSGTLKIWNVRSGRCVRTFVGCGYALSLLWLPGGRHLLLGCKDGSIRTFDVPAALMVQHLPGAAADAKNTEASLLTAGTAHEGPVWSLALHPDGLSCVSASADKTVKFWEFEMHTLAELRVLAGEGSAGGEDKASEALGAGYEHQQKQLVLVHVRTLKMTDDVLAAKFSPNGRLLALALLDATVKIFFADTLKFFLSLYGHKLPVLALDISADSQLVITASADKNVKIWGLDFGDCHRSLYAHEESVMACGFEQGMQGGGLLGGREGASHHFWTAGKDGLLKHWDGDRFELIQTCEGHHGEIWALAVDSKGTLAVTAGADRSIRTWEKTDEPLFLEEERERAMEKMYEAAGAAREADEGRAIGSLAPGAEDAEDAAAEAGAVQKSTAATLMAGERLMEALDIADEDRRNARLAAGGGRFGLAGRPPRNALLLAAFGQGIGGGASSDGGAIESGADAGGEPSAEGYVLKVVEKIAPAHLEDALLVLPFDKVISLMQYLDIWAKKDWSISLTSRILFFLLRTHHAQIVSNRVMRTTLIHLRAHLQAALGRQRDTMGFNLAALRHARGAWVAGRTAEMYERGAVGLEMEEEAVREKIEAGGRRKRKVAVV